MLVPVVGIVQVGSQSYADRYTYLPLVGIFIALSWSMADLLSYWRVPIALSASASAVVLIALAIRSCVQAGIWHDSLVLWQHAALVTRNNPMVSNNLGHALATRGRWTEARACFVERLRFEPNNADAFYNLGAVDKRAGRQGEALASFEKAVHLRPDHAQAQFHLGHIRETQGRLAVAAEHYAASIRSDPSNVDAHDRLAWVLSQQGLLQASIREYRKVLQLDPHRDDARTNLGLHLQALASRSFEEGKPGEAAAILREAISLGESAELWNRLGVALALKGERLEAVACFQRAIATDHAEAEFYFDFARSLKALGRNDMAASAYRQGLALDASWPRKAAQKAWQLATNLDPEHRNGALALELGLQACEATEFKHADALQALGAAYAELGQFQRAKETQQNAIALVPLPPDGPRMQAMYARLRSYEAHQPVREGSGNPP
jgi:tetratricopeptide (TPR) repeat protein